MYFQYINLHKEIFISPHLPYTSLLVLFGLRINIGLSLTRKPELSFLKEKYDLGLCMKTLTNIIPSVSKQFSVGKNCTHFYPDQRR